MHSRHESAPVGAEAQGLLQQADKSDSSLSRLEGQDPLLLAEALGHAIRTCRKVEERLTPERASGAHEVEIALRLEVARLHALSVRRHTAPRSTYPNDSAIAIIPSSIGQGDEQIRICIVSYKGNPCIDVRLWTRDGKDWRPNRAGRGLRFSKGNIPAVCAGLQAAVEKSEGK